MSTSMQKLSNIEVKFGQKARDAVQIFICWALWLLIGTVYYTYDLGTGWVKGFYMAVNVGYSVGWGYPVENTVGSRIFSMIYVLSGIFAVAVSLGYFAQSMISSSKNWYVTALRQEKFKTASLLRRIVLWRKMHAGSLRLVALWIVWIAAMVLFTMYTVQWRFTEALYFAVSSLSTGGLWPIPSDSPDWYFAVVAGFTAVGVPLMAFSMANIAAMFINTGDTDEAQKLIAAEVTLEELHMMQKFDLDDGDGQISRAEYILLCAVRIGALSPDLIEMINERFRTLDTSGDGVLSYSEILEVPEMDLSNNPRSSA